MIKINNLKKYYDKNKLSEQYVLKDISLTLPDTGLVSIFGPSGCGKTTLLNIIAGLDTPFSGTVTYNDEKITDSFRYENVGVIFQDFALIENKTVEENIRIGYVEATAQALKDTLKALDIEKLKDRRVSMLSGGEKQRVAIARAIIKKPAYLVADEPTGNLDLKNRMRVMQILKSLSKHFLVLLVSHDQELVSNYSDRIITLTDGMITQDKILHKDEEKQVYEIKKRNRFNLSQYMKDTFRMKNKTNFVIILFMITLTLLVTCLTAKLTGYNTLSANMQNQYITLSETISKEIFEEIQDKGYFIRQISVDSFTIPAEKRFDLASQTASIKDKVFPFYLYNNEKILFSKEKMETYTLPIYLTSSLANDILKKGRVGTYSYTSIKKLDIITPKDLLGSKVHTSEGQFEVIGIVESDIRGFLFDESYYLYKAHYEAPQAIKPCNILPLSIYQKYNPEAPKVENGNVLVFGLDTSTNYIQIVSRVYQIQEKQEETFEMNPYGCEAHCVLSDYDYYVTSYLSIFYTKELSIVRDILDRNEINYSVNAEMEYQLASNRTMFAYIILFILLSFLLFFSFFFTLLDTKNYTNSQLNDIIILRNLGITKTQVIQTYTKKLLLKLLPSFLIGFILSIFVTCHLKTYNYDAYYMFQLNFFTMLMSLLIGTCVLVITIYLYLAKKFSNSAATLRTKYRI